MENEINFCSDTLIQQDGPNKGTISDIELAIVGAQAEEKARNQKVINKLDYIFNGSIPLSNEEDLYIGIDNGVGRRYNNQQEQIEKRSNFKGEEAMEEEVRRRALKANAGKLIDSEARETIAEKTGDDFIKEQYRKSQERKSE